MSGQTPAKPKPQRATTSSKNRTTDSPPPFRSRNETSIEDFSQDFWQHALNVAEEHEDDFKHQALPLARIKKVAKMDPEVQGQMISSEVTVLFEKACQIFIQELTSRAHLVSLAARRRTLSRADVAQAVSRSDMFDFLIDIVPRTERAAASATATVSTSASASASTSANNAATSGSGSAKRPSRARKASQRDYDDLDDGEGVGENGAGGRSNIVTPHPLMDMPEGVVFATGGGVGGGLPQLPPAAKRARYTVGDGSDAGGVDQGQVAMEQATSQQQEQEGGGEYYSLGGYGGEVGTGGRRGGAGAPEAEGEVGGAEQWTGGFDYATAAADPALAAFYQAQQLAAATQLQQQQQQQQEGAGEGGGEGCYQEGV